MDTREELEEEESSQASAQTAVYHDCEGNGKDAIYVTLLVTLAIIAIAFIFATHYYRE